MVGISIEVVTAGGFAAHDAIENANNNPLNQPIVDVSAVATIVLNETNFVETQDWKAFPWVTSLILADKTNLIGSLHRGSTFAEFEMLTADDLSRITDVGSGFREYVIHFKTSTIFSRVSMNRAHKLVKDIDNIKNLGVSLNFIPTDTEVVGGSVDLIANGEFVKTFAIMPKKGSTNMGWAYFGLNLDATNLKFLRAEPNLKK